MRVPALQTLLLYSKSIDTNISFTRFLCDGWIEIRFLDSLLAQNLVSKVLYLRSSIEKLFKLKLETYEVRNKEDEGESEEESGDKRPRGLSSIEIEEKEFKIRNLTDNLKKKLVEFLDSDIIYSIKRMLPADVASAYISKYNSKTTNDDEQKVELEFLNKFEKFEENKVKGGYKVTDYLNYNW